MEKYCAKCQTSSPQNDQGHQNKESEKLSHMRGSQGAITMNCGVVPWKGKRTKKDVKSKDSVAFS